ncbi:uncharacterized protein C8R40DRAFT_1178297 [Lentinula edodes]|uniref:uncharacterized protein n=1 Tax=Lentinula edodes TaxID=5353 RepID=UPI001E8E0275|nr:uncharacterized protein C8R40DRAFT_1178297 [Lentinula edodes]KAH7868085.1 hypothetical protein C8R40DRAFT_1178297 [Lentinula edodes]
MNRRKVLGLKRYAKTIGNGLLSKLRSAGPRVNPASPSSYQPSILSDPPPFSIPPGCIKDGKKLDFPSTRDPYLPAIYEVKSHPRIPKDLNQNVIKRILIVPWPKGDAQFLKFYFNHAETRINIPGGRNSSIPALGWGKLEVGDIVFTRDVAGSGDGMDDMFEVYVGEIDEESEEGKLIKNLRDETLGPEAERCTNGCTAFEKCSKRANPVGGSGHCYSCGISHQKPRNLVTPSVGGKIRGSLSTEEEEHIQMRRNLVTTTIKLAVNMFRRILPTEYKILEDACELNNVPRIGTDDNALYQGLQLNVSQPVHGDGLIINCIKALAFFGGKHFDRHDSAGGWTTMFAYPDIPTGEGWEGGRFHLVEFGLYVELDKIKSITFSGLRLHGVVLYPQGAILDGRVTMNIAAGPNGVPIQLTPEMTNATVHVPSTEDTDGLMAEEDEEEPDLLHASPKELNFLDDGKVIMTPQAEIDFLARAFFLHTLYHQRQIMGGNVLKYDHYRQGWSMQRDGITFSAGPWSLAPDGLELTNHADSSPRQAARERWYQHCNKRLEAISSTFRNFKAPPIRIPVPQTFKKRSRTARAAAAQAAAHKRKVVYQLKARSKNRNRNRNQQFVSEIIHAAQKAPQAIEFNQEVAIQNLNKTKRDLNVNDKGQRRSKRLKENCDNGVAAIAQECQVAEEEQEEDQVYELRNIISHRICTKACCNYEYYVEWADKKPGTKEWIHESQIDMGDMYTAYRLNAFTQTVDVNMGSIDDNEQPRNNRNGEPPNEENRSSDPSPFHTKSTGKPSCSIPLQ